MAFSYFVLALAISISAIAAWYSIVGLTAIFAAAVVPIIVMGGALEIAKVTITVWLHQYWQLCRPLMKAYLVSAVFFLMVLTSMGIFGFLSKAHLDQAIPTGDAQAKLALYDEKIKTQRDNVEAARKAIRQMDDAVDQVMARTADEKGADKAAALRRSQARERTQLQNDIGTAQREIARLNEERAPIASEVRKVDAEVGPIKYIAALIYGDNPDANLLEKAVRWVIIIIVAVFDPLAIMMVLAATESIGWHRRGLVARYRHGSRIEESDPPKVELEEKHHARKLFNIPNAVAAPVAGIFSSIKSRFAKSEPVSIPETESSSASVLADGPSADVKPVDRTMEPADESAVQSESTAVKSTVPNIEVKFIGDADEEQEVPKSVVDVDQQSTAEEKVETEVAVSEPELDLSTDYITYEGKPWRREALMSMHPELWAVKVRADDDADARISFGTQFPESPNKSDQFLRVDYLPTKLFKYNGIKWIEVDKNLTDNYSYNQSYIEHLIEKISKGEYDPELLSDSERAQLESRLKQDLSLKR